MKKYFVVLISLILLFAIAGCEDSNSKESFTVTYLSDGNGVVQGEQIQVISGGKNAKQVTAKPNVGYEFSSWSDGVTSASRTDKNITKNISVTANFTRRTDGKEDFAKYQKMLDSAISAKTISVQSRITSYNLDSIFIIKQNFEDKISYNDFVLSQEYKSKSYNYKGNSYFEVDGKRQKIAATFDQYMADNKTTDQIATLKLNKDNIDEYQKTEIDGNSAIICSLSPSAYNTFVSENNALVSYTTAETITVTLISSGDNLVGQKVRVTYSPSVSNASEINVNTTISYDFSLDLPEYILNDADCPPIDQSFINEIDLAEKKATEGNYYYKSAEYLSEKLIAESSFYSQIVGGVNQLKYVVKTDEEIKTSYYDGSYGYYNKEGGAKAVELMSIDDFLLKTGINVDSVTTEPNFKSVTKKTNGSSVEYIINLDCFELAATTGSDYVDKAQIVVTVTNDKITQIDNVLVFKAPYMIDICNLTSTQTFGQIASGEEFTIQADGYIYQNQKVPDGEMKNSVSFKTNVDSETKLSKDGKSAYVYNGLNIYKYDLATEQIKNYSFVESVERILFYGDYIYCINISSQITVIKLTKDLELADIYAIPNWSTTAYSREITVVGDDLFAIMSSGPRYMGLYDAVKKEHIAFFQSNFYLHSMAVEANENEIYFAYSNNNSDFTILVIDKALKTVIREKNIDAKVTFFGKLILDEDSVYLLNYRINKQTLQITQDYSNVTNIDGLRISAVSKDKLILGRAVISKSNGMILETLYRDDGEIVFVDNKIYQVIYKSIYSDDLTNKEITITFPKEAQASFVKKIQLSTYQNTVLFEHNENYVLVNDGIVTFLDKITLKTVKVYDIDKDCGNAVLDNGSLYFPINNTPKIVKLNLTTLDVSEIEIAKKAASIAVGGDYLGFTTSEGETFALNMVTKEMAKSSVKLDAGYLFNLVINPIDKILCFSNRTLDVGQYLFYFEKGVTDSYPNLKNKMFFDGQYFYNGSMKLDKSTLEEIDVLAGAVNYVDDTYIGLGSGLFLKSTLQKVASIPVFPANISAKIVNYYFDSDMNFIIFGADYYNSLYAIFSAKQFETEDDIISLPNKEPQKHILTQIPNIGSEYKMTYDASLEYTIVVNYDNEVFVIDKFGKTLFCKPFEYVNGIAAHNGELYVAKTNEDTYVYSLTDFTLKETITRGQNCDRMKVTDDHILYYITGQYSSYFEVYNKNTKTSEKFRFDTDRENILYTNACFDDTGRLFVNYATQNRMYLMEVNSDTGAIISEFSANVKSLYPNDIFVKGDKIYCGFVFNKNNLQIYEEKYALGDIISVTDELIITSRGVYTHDGKLLLHGWGYSRYTIIGNRLYGYESNSATNDFYYKDFTELING